jgi:hypothetical protein
MPGLEEIGGVDVCLLGWMVRGCCAARREVWVWRAPPVLQGAGLAPSMVAPLGKAHAAAQISGDEGHGCCYPIECPNPCSNQAGCETESRLQDACLWDEAAAGPEGSGARRHGGAEDGAPSLTADFTAPFARPRALARALFVGCELGRVRRPRLGLSKWQCAPKQPGRSVLHN